ncbi:ABC transporter substrate-binding protein [Streptococcus pneumoniae]|nr:ABC transporter substrate-binding protein [Streptococcus pneumoniae]
MRKGTMLSVVAGLSLAILAGCSGGTNSKQASSSNDIKVWVQFSDETNEGKA